jgi:nitrous oxide reductase accessory protein NosL
MAKATTKAMARDTERVTDMRQTLIALAALIVLLAGCRQKTASSEQPAPAQQVSASATALTPEQLGEIGAQIHRHPSDAPKILADRGITPEEFEKAIRNVAQDPDAARRYRDAYKKAG